MTSGPNPAFSADATRKALVTDDIASAARHDTTEQRAALDEAELRGVERAEYYGAADQPSRPVSGPAPARRSLLDRLFRRP